tara:strand:- start:199 stop:414 length:216 start_codon:yes stop_codon:yes gene_type:complete
LRVIPEIRSESFDRNVSRVELNPSTNTQTQPFAAFPADTPQTHPPRSRSVTPRHQHERISRADKLTLTNTV